MVLDIEQNTSFSGFTVTHTNVTKRLKVIQYADDTVLCVKDHKNIYTAIESLHKFCTTSGLKLNLSKTEAIKTGRNKQVTDCRQKLKWTESTKCLGIYVGHDKERMNKLNWDLDIESLNNTLTMWKKRDLTLFGKILIIKSLGISKLIYTAMNTYIPEYVIGKVNKLLYNFIWKNKDRIKCHTIINKLEEGGLNMIDIECQFQAVKATWIPRILSQSDQNWPAISLYFFNKIAPNNIWLHMNVDTETCMPSIKSIPSFQKQILLSFNKTKKVKNPENKKDLYNQII